MEGTEVRNEQGELLLPQSQFNSLEPVNGAKYIDDAEYEAAKSAPKAPEVTEATDTTDVTEAQAPAVETKDEVDYDAIVKAKTEGKFDTWEAMMSKLSAETTEAIEYSENSKKIIEALKEGKEDELAEILYQRKVLSGADKMDESEAIKLAIQIQNPDFSAEDIEDEYDQRYGIGVDKDDMDDAEYAKIERRAKRKLATDAKVAKEFLVKLKDDIKLPDFKTATAEADPEAMEFITKTESFQKQFSESLENNLKSFDKLDLSIADQDVQFKHEYSISDVEKSDLRTKASDYWKYLESRYAKDGKYDTQKLAVDIFKIENFDRILKSSITRASNLAKVELVKGVANVSSTGIPSPATNPSTEKAQSDFKRFYLGE
jgi:hypothetical protein